MKCSKSILKTLAVLLLLVILVPTVVQANKVDYHGHNAEKNIQSLLSKGIVSGYPDGTYRPDEGISRAEFISIVNRAFNLEKTGNINFRDVKDGDWFYKDIERAVGEAYISGYEDGTLRPQKPITRQEASIILGRLLAKTKGKHPISTYATRIKDWDDMPNWSKLDINKMVREKIMWLDDDNSFRYKDDLTRGEMAIAIDRILEIQGNKLEDEQDVLIGIGDKEVKTSHNKEDFIQLIFRKDKIDIFGSNMGTEDEIAIMVNGEDYAVRDDFQIIDGKYSGDVKLPNGNGNYTISTWIGFRTGISTMTGHFMFEVEDGQIEIIQSNILGHNMKVYELRNHMKDIYLNTNYIEDKDKFNNVLDNIIGRDDSYYTKAYKIASWVSENIYYDHDHYERGSTWLSPKDVLGYRYTVCEGYANLTDILMRLAGLPSRKVSGYALGGSATISDLSSVEDQTNHAWNEVLIDGRWVIIDTTWNSSNKREDGINIMKQVKDFLIYQ